MSEDRRVDRVSGRAVPLRGHDIDTDRIIPARYLRSVRFEGLEQHVFADDRQDPAHPFARPEYQGASILLVNRNFGCGSSREHAPQALQRWGIRAIVGESFSEIFFGNSVALGLPCFVVEPGAVDILMASVEATPALVLTTSVAEGSVWMGAERFAAHLPDAARDALLTGAWDATGLLLDRFDEVQATAARLPYLGEFR